MRRGDGVATSSSQPSALCGAHADIAIHPIREEAATGRRHGREIGDVENLSGAAAVGDRIAVGRNDVRSFAEGRAARAQTLVEVARAIEAVARVRDRDRGRPSAPG